LVKAVERDLLAASCDGLQFRFGQVSTTFLDLVEFLDDRSVGRHQNAPGISQKPIRQGTIRVSSGVWKHTDPLHWLQKGMSRKPDKENLLLLSPSWTVTVSTIAVI